MTDRQGVLTRARPLRSRLLNDEMPPIIGGSRRLGQEGMSHRSSSWRISALATRLLELPRRVRSRWRLQREISLLARSGFFDRDWYLAHYPDVAAASIDPIRHYLLHGAQEGRNPSPNFDTRFYLAQYQDVNEAGVNPLAHFLRFGKSEGRTAVSPASSTVRRKGDLENPAKSRRRSTCKRPQQI